jgi:hypothetical protein
MAGRLIERFMPEADVRELHEVRVRAPAELVFGVAETFDVQSLRPVRALFWLRAKLLGADVGPARWPRGLVAETRTLGWVELALEPGRQRVMGAVTRPWKANVRFTAVAPEQFLAFSEPDLVKIVWTLEAVPVSPEVTLFRTETRVLATDEGARRKFRRYWRVFGAGIVLIRLLLLPALRREAERRHADVSGRGCQP